MASYHTFQILQCTAFLLHLQQSPLRCPTLPEGPAHFSAMQQEQQHLQSFWIERTLRQLISKQGLFYNEAKLQHHQAQQMLFGTFKPSCMRKFIWEMWALPRKMMRTASKQTSLGYIRPTGTEATKHFNGCTFHRCSMCALPLWPTTH